MNASCSRKVLCQERVAVGHADRPFTRLGQPTIGVTEFLHGVFNGALSGEQGRR